MIKEHDVVALTTDLQGDMLRRGDVGAVVHVHDGGEACEVEFVDERGRTIGVVTVPVTLLIRLNLLRLTA